MKEFEQIEKLKDGEFKIMTANEKAGVYLSNVELIAIIKILWRRKNWLSRRLIGDYNFLTEKTHTLEHFNIKLNEFRRK